MYRLGMNGSKLVATKVSKYHDVTNENTSERHYFRSLDSTLAVLLAL